MPHQIALTVIAPVKPGEAEELKRLLTALGDGGPDVGALPFGQLPMVHFARLFVLDEAQDLTGIPIPAQLVFLTDLDAPRYRYLRRLVKLAGDTLDRIFQHCEGYPDPGQRTVGGRLAYLHGRTIKADTVYVNTIGRSVRQIRQEAALREAIQAFLDRPDQQWTGRSPTEIHAAIRTFLGDDEELGWALEPARPPGRIWRAKQALHFVAVPLLVFLFAPVLLIAAPFWLIALRRHERTDPVPDIRFDHARAEELAAAEDHVVQNPLSAVGSIKAGRFRLLTTLGVLRLIDYTTRHIFNRGSLAGITTIHFARWVFIDDRRRLVFASSYDGSLESYMDDFIDKVAWGLNAVFSNGVGYPRTRWLVLDGATDELAFKKFLRSYQVPTQLWYSAYDRLTNANIANNAAIRAGLASPMSDEEAQRWLRRL
jgi:hypothetical protein